MSGKFDTDLSNAYGDVSPQFHARVEQTINDIRLEEVKPMKQITLRTALIIAAALVVLSGVALAVGDALGLIDIFSSRHSLTPGDGAKDSVSTNLYTAQTERLSFALREAVYDGMCVRALIEVAPLEPEKFIVGFIGDSEGEDNSMQTIIDDEIAERTGRTILKAGFLSLDFGNDKEGYMNLYMNTLCVRTYREDDKLLIYTETGISSADGESPPDTLELRYSLHLGNDYAEVYIPFILEKCELERADYAPVDSPIPGVELTGVSVTQTPFANYLNIAYTYTSPEYGLVYSPGVKYYGTKFGIFIHTDETCSGMLNAIEMSYDEAVATYKQLCPVCASGENPRMEGEEWAFVYADAQSEFFSYMSYGRSTLNGTIRPNVYAFTQTLIYQRADLPLDAIALNALKSGEDTGITIVCERIAPDEQ